MKAPMKKAMGGKKAMPFMKKGKSDAPEMAAEGEAAPKRMDRPARKSGGPAKTSGC